MSTPWDELLDKLNKNKDKDKDKTTNTTAPVNTDTLNKAIEAYTVDNPAAPAPETVKTTDANANTAGTSINPNSGQVTAPLPNVNQTQATATTATVPKQVETELANVFSSTKGVNTSLQQMKDVIGKLSPEAQAQVAQMPPDQLAALGLSAAQIEQAQQVTAPIRTLQQGELVDGSSVDMNQVDQTLNNIQAATADPTKNATVQGQLEGLMSQFKDGNVPAWASGAIRQANAALAARGLGASSMAGQAVIQATMESAVPIAMADAQTYAQFEMQNLTNRQQVVMFAAQQRAAFLGQKFDQDFQSKVLNAAKISEIANVNHSTEVQVALENARLAQTVDLANLDAKNALIMQNAAAMTQVDLANLNNRQQTALQNAQAFLQMDMANLDYAQQKELFKAQARVQSIMSDTAAQNAASQFNASSINQANQFFAELGSQVNMFNASQKNSMSQFNAGEANALAQFQASMEEQRRQFNANNRLVIDQSNAEWRRQVTLQNNANVNEANRINAQLASQMSMAEYNNEMQTRRDAMNYAFTSSENAQNRATQLAMAKMSAEQARAMAKSSSKDAMWGAVGSVAAAWVGSW